MGSHERNWASGLLFGVAEGTSIYGWLNSHGFLSASTLIAFLSTCLMALIQLDRIAANLVKLAVWIRVLHRIVTQRLF